MPFHCGPEAAHATGGSSRQDAELAGLLKASRVVLRFSTFLESARAIFEEAKLLTGATAGYVALLSEDGAENDVLFLDSGDAPCSVDPELPMPVRGLRAAVYATQQTAFENQFWESDWRSFLPEGHVQMRNVMFAPLTIEGRTVGIMGLANKEGDFSHHDGEIASAFAQFAALALANSRNLERLQRTVTELQETLAHVRTLREILPICITCGKVRTDEGYWSKVDTYLREFLNVDLSHGFCPKCAEKAFREWGEEMGEPSTNGRASSGE